MHVFDNQASAVCRLNTLSGDAFPLACVTHTATEGGRLFVRPMVGRGVFVLENGSARREHRLSEPYGESVSGGISFIKSRSF